MGEGIIPLDGGEKESQGFCEKGMEADAGTREKKGKSGRMLYYGKIYHQHDDGGGYE